MVHMILYIYIYINNFYKFYEIYKIYLYHIIFSRYLFKLTLFSKLSYFELLWSLLYYQSFNYILRRHIWLQHDGHVCRTRKRIIDGKRSHKLIIANLEREQLRNIVVNIIKYLCKILMIAYCEIIRYE